MDLFQTALIIATFLCSLVAGFLFAFAVVVMPGIKGLNHREYIQAFQVMDENGLIAVDSEAEVPGYWTGEPMPGLYHGSVTPFLE